MTGQSNVRNCISLLHDPADTGQIPVIGRHDQPEPLRKRWQFAWTARQAIAQVLIAVFAVTALTVAAWDAIHNIIGPSAEGIVRSVLIALAVALPVVRYGARLVAFAERKLTKLRQISAFLEQFALTRDGHHEQNQQAIARLIAGQEHLAQVQARAYAAICERVDELGAEVSAVNGAVRTLGTDVTKTIQTMQAQIKDQRDQIATLRSEVDQWEKWRSNAALPPKRRQRRPARNPRSRGIATTLGGAGESTKESAMNGSKQHKTVMNDGELRAYLRGVYDAGQNEGDQGPNPVA